ncbi:MAG: hypothetical protein ABFE13_12470 [Phycisphaerales bacterium]
MAKREPRKRKEAADGKRVLVWHVFHWKERYAVDPRDWPADRGLLFVRQVVSPVDTESTHYLGQLRDLETLSGDWRQYHLWKSMWEDLRAMTATQGRVHQGYLLDEHQQPLKEVQIAARLHADLEETRRALEALRAVNLMERVPLPAFGEIKRVQAEQDETNGRDKAICAAQSRARKRSCAQDGASVANAPVGEGVGNGPGAGEISDSEPSGGAGGHTPAAAEGHLPLKGNGLNGNGNPNQNERTTNGPTEDQVQAEVAEPSPTQAKGGTAAEPGPPTTQPIKPKGAEAEGGVAPVRHTGPKLPPPSLDGHTASIGSVVKQVIRRLSPDAQQFAEWVYVKLGLADPPNSEPWRREVAAIGGVWIFATMNLPPTHLEDYRKWAYKRAEDLRDKRAQYANHIRKWMSDAKFEVRNRKKKVR